MMRYSISATAQDESSRHPILHKLRALRTVIGQPPRLQRAWLYRAGATMPPRFCLPLSFVTLKMKTRFRSQDGHCVSCL